MKFTAKCFSILFVFAFFNFSYAQKAVENKNLPNFHQVNENLYRGGQPTEEGIKQLAGQVKTIVYLRGLDEREKTEEKWAKASNIGFKSFPLSNWFSPKDSQIKDILAFINDPQNQPVFVHCQRGADRTGTVIAVYRISHDGKTAKEAIDEAKKFHLGWWQFWMKDFIKDYYRDFKKDS